MRRYPFVDDVKVQDRFWSKVEFTGFCWEWTAALDNGYGMFFLGNVDGRRIIKHSHVVAWDMLMGGRTEGLVLDHLCRIRKCVNPDHLEQVTSGENSRRGYGLGKPKFVYRQEMCSKGLHLMSEHAKPNGSGRCCAPCRTNKRLDALGAAK